MRRTILLALAVVLLMGFAPSARAATPPKGCPAEASVWTEVGYVTSGVYTASSFYTWYWNVGRGAAIDAFLTVQPTWTDQIVYFFFADSFVNVADRNADSLVCVSWLGANPGVPDEFISIVDNNSATKN